MVYAIRSWNDWWLDNDDDDDDDSNNPDADTIVHQCRSWPPNAEVTSDDVTSSKCCCSNKNNNKKRRRRRKLLLDIRSDEEYQRRHLLSSNFTTTMNNQCNKNDNCDCKCNHDDDIICRCKGCFMVVVVHIPYRELKGRRFELPPRRTPFGIFFSIDDKNDNEHETQQMIQDLLSGHGNTITTTTNASDPRHLQNRRLTQSWHVTALIDANDPKTWQSAQQCCAVTVAGAEYVYYSPIHDNLTSNCHAVDDNNGIDTTTISTAVHGRCQPLPRLWKPDSLVEHVLLPLLLLQPTPFGQSVAHIRLDNDETIASSSSSVEVWDLGAGLGRDVCFLAEELLYHWNTTYPTTMTTTTTTWMNGKNNTHHLPTPWRVIGFDQRYRNVHVNDSIDFWKRRHVDTITACQLVDFSRIRHVTDLFEMTPAPTSHDKNHHHHHCRRVVRCIYAVRYWNKLLFQSIIHAGLKNDPWLPKGTMIAISHFGKASIHSTWDFPHPKEQHVLERYELRDMFTNPTTTRNDPPGGTSNMSNPLPSSWQILHDQVVLDSNHGRTIIQFVAQLV